MLVEDRGRLIGEPALGELDRVDVGFDCLAPLAPLGVDVAHGPVSDGVRARGIHGLPQRHLVEPLPRLSSRLQPDLEQHQH